jgi:hypothetical protein
MLIERRLNDPSPILACGAGKPPLLGAIRSCFRPRNNLERDLLCNL